MWGTWLSREAERVLHGNRDVPVTELTDESGQPIDSSVVIDVSPPSGVDVPFALPTAVAAPEAQNIPLPAAPVPPAGDVTPAGGSDPAAIAAEPPAPVPFYKRFNLPEDMVPDEETAAKSIQSVIEEARAVYAQSQQEKQWADLGRRMYQERQQQAAQPAAPAAPVAEAQPKALPWSPVPADPLWERYRDPATGSYHVDKMPAPMQDSFLRYSDGVRQFTTQMYRQPDQVLQPIIEQATQPLMAEIQQLKQHLERIPAEQESKQWLDQNESWLLARSPLTGRPTLTPAGQHFTNTYQQYLQAGVPERQAREVAVMATERAAMLAHLQQQQTLGAQAPQGAAGAPAPSANDAAKAALLATNVGAATRAASRAGSIVAATPAAPQSRVLSREDDITRRIHEAMRAHGVTDEATQLSYSSVQ